MLFILLDTSYIYYIPGYDVVYLRRNSWVTCAQYDVNGVEDDDVTIFLKVTLIQRIQYLNLEQV